MVTPMSPVRNAPLIGDDDFIDNTCQSLQKRGVVKSYSRDGILANGRAEGLPEIQRVVIRGGAMGAISLPH